MRKTVMIMLTVLLLTFACAANAAGAEGRDISVFTRVLPWGQLPERFEVAGQDLPGDVAAEDFAITGRAAAWGTNDWYPFSCAVRAVEAGRGGWTLIPERFPVKYFSVREMEVACAAHPELSFSLADIGRTFTETADDFTDVEDHDSRMTAHVYMPEHEEPLPVVLVFHGYGDDHNLLSYRTSVAWAEPESQAVRPCIVIAPTINTIYYGSEIARSRIYEGIVGYIDGLIASGRADANRIYVMGNSFGGMASFEIAEQHPGRFAAILALCPALNYSARGTAGLSELTDIPVWIAQAERDETIPSEVGKSAAAALTEAGNPNVKLTIYTDEEMNACGAVFGQEQLYSFHHVELAVMEDEAYARWLFEQARE